MRLRAVGALLLACVFWGVGFPISKGLTLGAAKTDPGVSSWFLAAFLIGVRFFVGTIVVFAVNRTAPNRRELVQGVLLGAITGFGMIFQLDGLVYTEASTSAFLTQGYIMFLPAASAVMTRRAPTARVVACTILVTIGLGILARFDPRTLSMGRGEAETLFAAACFTFQILLLDAERFRENRTGPVSTAMFATMFVVTLPALFGAARGARDLGIPLAAPGAVWYFAIIIALPTLGSFTLMNRYQRLVTATEAGITYAMEPVFASAAALVLPSWISRVSGIVYPNETLDTRILAGGALVVSANVLLAFVERGPAAPGGESGTVAALHVGRDVASSAREAPDAAPGDREIALGGAAERGAGEPVDGE